MWIQLDQDVLEKLAVLASGAKMSQAANRIRHSISQGKQDLIKQYREAARDRFGEEGVCEIDDDAAVSTGDDAGAYVMTWRWIESPSTSRTMDETCAAGAKGND